MLRLKRDMKIELTKYRNIRPTISSMIQNNFNRDHVDLVANIAVACNCPVIVCCYYYAEALGYMPEETKKQINTLMEFYKYDTVLGVETLKEWK